jgi:surface antigen
MTKLIKNLAICTIITGTLFIGGCAEQNVSKQKVGTLVGVGLGALAGSHIGGGEGQVLATVVGAGLGGYIGNKMGMSLDKADALYYNKSLNNSLEYNPTGVTSTWRNPDSGNYGKITPKTTYAESGLNCREFTQEVMIGGKKQEAFGKACRMNDGAWKIIS